MNLISERITSFPHLYLPESSLGYLAGRARASRDRTSTLGRLLQKLDIRRWWRRTRFHFDLTLLEGFEVTQADVDRDLL